MTSGGYDTGYESCPCFWGTSPGSLVKALSSIYGRFDGLQILDAGCGEGKNAYYLANQGATVRAIDISQKAILNGQRVFGTSSRLEWQAGDIRLLNFAKDEFDIVVAYGLLHCFNSEAEVHRIIRNLKFCTKLGGVHVLCAFNDRDQDLTAHPGFEPTLLPHDEYLAAYSDWELLQASDSNLVETHPHNSIEHHHSMTRIIARRRS